MAFQTLSTANTFSQWITETQRSVSILNQVTDGGGSFTYYANTNVDVDNNLNIGGNLTVGGLIVLDDIGYNDLNVAGNLSVVQSLTSLNGSFENLVVTNNVAALNVTTIEVGTDAVLNALIVTGNYSTDNITINGNITGTSNLFVSNLVITGNANFVNETSNIFVGTDVEVYGDLIGQLFDENGVTVSGELRVDIANIDEANIFTLIGTANTNIYNNIFASNAYTSVQNTLAEFASLSCILG
jgi:hypothetical protein